MPGLILQPSQNAMTSGSLRPRSGTAGSASEAAEAPVHGTAATRPGHFRSRSYLSHLSPVDPKVSNAVTLPTETSLPANRDAPALARRDSESYFSPRIPKLHFPGHKSRHSHDFVQNGQESMATHQRSHIHVRSRRHSHRHTKSDIPARWSNVANAGSEVDLSSHNHSQTHLAPNDGTLLHPAVAAAKSGGMMTRISSNLSSKNVGTPQHKPRHQYSASDFHKGRSPAAVGAFSAPGGRPDMRRRATSDPRTPLHQAMRDGMAARYGVAGYIDGTVPIQQERKPPLTEIEALLLIAEKRRKAEEASLTEADVTKLVTQLAESQVDLQEQLANNNRTAWSLMRRLDDAHEMLVSTASSLVDTISSFQNLCQQSEALIGNFERRADELDRETKRTLDRRRKDLFDQRGHKISALEERGRKASKKAEEMSRRLENCRTIVQNFAERQHTKRRAWRGVMVGTLSGMAVIVLGLVLGLCLWWHQLYGRSYGYDVHDAVARILDQQGLVGVHGDLCQVVRDRIKGHEREEAKRKVRVLDSVPDEVKAVLQDIAHRHNGTHPYMATVAVADGESTSSTERYIPRQATRDIDDDKKLKTLFDKLDL